MTEKKTGFVISIIRLEYFGYSLARVHHLKNGKNEPLLNHLLPKSKAIKLGSMAILDKYGSHVGAIWGPKEFDKNTDQITASIRLPSGSGPIEYLYGDQFITGPGLGDVLLTEELAYNFADVLNSSNPIYLGPSAIMFTSNLPSRRVTAS
jgi:hypothetical protein